MDDAYQEELRQLGLAINNAITGSTEVDSALETIRKLGIDVFLVIEATICIRRQGEDAAGVAEESDPASLDMTSEDEQFLRRLRISIDSGDAE